MENKLVKNLKQLCLVGLLLVLTSAVSGQIKSGPIVAVSAGWLEKGQIFGPSYGTQYGTKDGKWNSQINFQLGYQFLFPLKNNFAINTSLLYMSRGVHVAYDKTFEDKVDESKRFFLFFRTGFKYDPLVYTSGIVLPVLRRPNQTMPL